VCWKINVNIIPSAIQIIATIPVEIIRFFSGGFAYFWYIFVSKFITNQVAKSDSEMTDAARFDTKPTLFIIFDVGSGNCIMDSQVCHSPKPEPNNTIHTIKSLPKAIASTLSTIQTIPRTMWHPSVPMFALSEKPRVKNEKNSPRTLKHRENAPYPTSPVIAPVPARPAIHDTIISLESSTGTDIELPFL